MRADVAKRTPSNPSNAGDVCNLRKGCFGTAFEDHGALLPGNVAGRRECLPRLFLSVAAEREQAFAAQAVDFRQIKAHAGFIHRGDGAVKVSETVRGPARSEQHLGRQTEIILRHWPSGRGLVDFGVDELRCLLHTDLPPSPNPSPPSC